LLTERRVFAPYGLNGGRPGKIGRNILLRASDGVRDNLGAKISLNVNPGVKFFLKSIVIFSLF